MKIRSILLAALGLLPLSGAPAAEPVAPRITVWPRAEKVSMPTGATQFMFVELPKLAPSGEWTLELELPANVKVNGFPGGSSPAVPPTNLLLTPEKWSQDGNKLVCTFARDAFENRENGWLPISMHVETPEGDHRMAIRAIDSGKLLAENEFDVKIYPPLVRATSDKIPIVVWYYTGLDPEYVPDFMEQFTAAGVNGFYSMEGERLRGRLAQNTVCDLAPQYGVEQGVVFFSSWVRGFAEKEKLLEAENGVYSLQWMLDNPESFKKAFKAYIDYTTGGKPHNVIIYDAEAGCLRRDKIEGDLSDYSLKKFSAEVNSDHTLTPEEIFEKHPNEWMWFNCRQTNQIARLAREAVDESYPGTLFMVYSGYEYDSPPYTDLTRKNYSVDWKSLTDEVFLDYAGAGYYGSKSELEHTRDVIGGAATYVPADMYLENFLSKATAPTPEQWTLRLIRTYLNAGMRGISLWYANDISGAGLIAISEFTRFALMMEDYAMRGELDPEAVTVSPKSEAENVFVIRDTRRAAIVILNNTDREKTISLTLNGFKINGYTSDIQIINLTTGETYPARPVQRVKAPPMSWQVITVMDDGN